MSFDDLLIHTLTIERASDGAVDAYNQPTRTWATLAEVRGRVQPKTALEVAQLNEAGAVASTFTIFLRPTDLAPSDRITVVGDQMAGLYEIDGIRNAAGVGHHLQVDARMVTA